eukprot:scaffold27288_cov49-Attheya_sp.AAC.1
MPATEEIGPLTEVIANTRKGADNMTEPTEYDDEEGRVSLGEVSGLTWSSTLPPSASTYQTMSASASEMHDGKDDALPDAVVALSQAPAEQESGEDSPQEASVGKDSAPTETSKSTPKASSKDAAKKGRRRPALPRRLSITGLNKVITELAGKSAPKPVITKNSTLKTGSESDSHANAEESSLSPNSIFPKVPSPEILAPKPAPVAIAPKVSPKLSPVLVNNKNPSIPPSRATWSSAQGGRTAAYLAKQDEIRLEDEKRMRRLQNSADGSISTESTTPRGHVGPEALLVRYLQQTGADPSIAEAIARDFATHHGGNSSAGGSSRPPNPPPSSAGGSFPPAPTPASNPRDGSAEAKSRNVVSSSLAPTNRIDNLRHETSSVAPTSRIDMLRHETSSVAPTSRIDKLRHERSEKMGAVIRNISEAKKRNEMRSPNDNERITNGAALVAAQRSKLESINGRKPASVRGDELDASFSSHRFSYSSNNRRDSNPSTSTPNDIESGNTEDSAMDGDFQQVTRPGAVATAGRAFGAMPRWAFGDAHALPSQGTRRTAGRRSSLQTIDRSRPSRDRNDDSNHSPGNTATDEEDGPEEPDDEDGPEEPDDEDDAEQNLDNERVAIDRPFPQHQDEDNGSAADDFVVEAMATAVADDHEENTEAEYSAAFTLVVPMVTGTPLPSTIKLLWEDKKARTIFKILLFVLVILGISLIVAGVKFDAFRRSKPIMGFLTDSPTLSPSASPTVDASDLKAILLQFSSIEDLEEVGSPQQKALLWLANKDLTGIEFTDDLFLERYAVVVFYYATQVNGNTWLARNNFLNAFTHVCDWVPAVMCKTDIGNPRRRVIGLGMNRNRLNGKLPSEVGLLRELTKLSLAGNSITGSIPREITKLSTLRSLNLANNKLSGSLPDIGDLAQLIELDLCDNRLTGSLPESLYSLVKIGLDHNQFSGSIPTLTVPAFRLEEFTFSHNNLEGDLNDPYVNIDFTLLPKLRIRKIDWSYNNFTGQLPRLVFFLPTLEFLSLHDNFLTGSLPKLPIKIESMSVNNNNIGGSLPTEIGNMKHLKFLDFSHNNLIGSIPSEVGNMKQIGSIPFEIANAPSLTQINLDCNLLSNTIPSSLGKIVGLKSLSIENNTLTGAIPTELGNLGTLQELRLPAVQSFIVIGRKEMWSRRRKLVSNACSLLVAYQGSRPPIGTVDCSSRAFLLSGVERSE